MNGAAESVQHRGRNCEHRSITVFVPGTECNCTSAVSSALAEEVSGTQPKGNIGTGATCTAPQKIRRRLKGKFAHLQFRQGLACFSPPSRTSCS